MNKLERIDYLKSKQRWNIWRIKNRFLRAAFTLLVMTPILALVVILVAVIAILAGMGEGTTYAWSVFVRNSDAKKIGRVYWRAVTLGDAP